MAKEKETVSAPAKEQPVKYELCMLRKDSQRLFGISSAAFTAATNGCTEKMTIAEAQQRINQWKARPVIAEVM